MILFSMPLTFTSQLMVMTSSSAAWSDTSLGLGSVSLLLHPTLFLLTIPTLLTLQESLMKLSACGAIKGNHADAQSYTDMRVHKLDPIPPLLTSTHT